MTDDDTPKLPLRAATGHPQFRDAIPDEVRAWRCVACGRFGPSHEMPDGCACSLAEKMRAWASYVTSPDVRRDMERTATWLEEQEKEEGYGG